MAGHQDLPSANELAAHSLDQQHPLTRSWVPAAQRLSLLATEHRMDIDLAVDPALATARRDRFGPEHPVDAFFNQWVQVSPDLSVMLSIRYEGGDPARPFVDVSALTRAATSADIASVAEATRARYGALGPRYLRWWSCERSGHYPNSSQDKRFLAAPVDQLARTRVPAELRLQRATAVEHYDEARQAYAQVDTDHPEHPEQAVIEARADLELACARGLLFDVVWHGSWAGYVAVARGHRLGLPGYKVAELLLATSARGHGLGQFLTPLLARHLLDRATTPAPVLIGTIHAGNTGALRAAMRGGRHDVGGWVTAPL